MISTRADFHKDAVIKRARESCGTSSHSIYEMVAKTINERHHAGGTLIDVGCGRGELWPHVASLVTAYTGADVIRYEGFPNDGFFVNIDLDTGKIPLPDGGGDIVVAVETIEHLENPRALFRELTRLSRAGGLIVVTTPNQRSLLSLMTLIVRGEFNAFREAPGLYPSHITSLLEVDLVRMARECGLHEIQVAYSGHGRVPGTAFHWPQVPGFSGRWFSDNLLISATVPAVTDP